MTKLFLTVGLVLGLLPFNLWAHPVTYQGGTAVMTWNQPFLNDLWAIYSLRYNLGVGVRGMRMEMDQGNTYFYAPQLDWLVQRWNGESYQANIYTYGALGGVNVDGKNGFGGLVGAEADIESRRWFLLGKWESMFANVGDDLHQVVGRVGVAPYEADFDELATWVMFQAQYHPALTRELALTPLLRLMYGNVLLEGGASINGDWLANFMVHF